MFTPELLMPGTECGRETIKGKEGGNLYVQYSTDFEKQLYKVDVSYDSLYVE